MENVQNFDEKMYCEKLCYKLHRFLRQKVINMALCMY